MTTWQNFVSAIPDPVKEVIANGPMPYSDYGRADLTWADKKRGLMVYKGGEGRGAGQSPKTGHIAVVYFDPSFSQGDYRIDPSEVPRAIEELHSESEVERQFDQL